MLKCTSCHSTFSLWKNLRRHMKVKHGEIEWQCGSCPKRFLRKDSFLRHHKKQHLKKRKPLSPLLRRTKTLIDDMLARQKIGQLSEIEENRLKNLYHQQEVLSGLEEADLGKESGGPVKRKRTTDTPGGPPARKSARLQVGTSCVFTRVFLKRHFETK